MTHADRRIALSPLLVLLLMLALLTGTPRSVAAQPAFGVNYWPEQYGANVLINSQWTSVNRAAIQKDLDHLASLGCRVVRLSFQPGHTGYTLNPYPNGGTIGTQYNEVVANLPTLLSYFQSRGIKVIIAFHNEYLRTQSWSGSYTNFTAFMNDSKTWTQGIVNAAKNSAWAANVLYYDFANEVDDGNPHSWNYVNAIYDANFVPIGKRGVSILQVPRDSDKLAQQLAGRVLQFVDFHSYPAGGLNADIETAYTRVKARFPSATVLLGEFGQSSRFCQNAGAFPAGKNDIACMTAAECVSPSFPNATCSGGADEATQSATVMNVINRAITRGIPYYLHWTLWDGPYPSGAFGLGVAHDVPKDVLGAVSARLNAVANPDMETLSGSIPSGWSAGGTVPVTLSAGFGDAATGARYARLRVDNQSTGLVWLVSPVASVAGKTMLDLNFYARSTMTSVRAEIHEYNSSGIETRVVASPAFTPVGWSMKNYHHAPTVGTWRLSLQSTTTTVRVAIVANANAANPDYLDVDTVSVFAR